jgi:hypothetical protein
MYRIKLIGRADGIASVRDGKWLVSCDVDARDGAGEIMYSPIEDMARTFESAGDAMAYWQRTSTVHPVRLSDGKPNKPLTAYTVEISKVGGGAYAEPTAPHDPVH